MLLSRDTYLFENNMVELAATLEVNGRDNNKTWLGS